MSPYLTLKCFEYLLVLSDIGVILSDIDIILSDIDIILSDIEHMYVTTWSS